MARITDGNNTNIVGDNIKRFRLEKELSQQQLSDRLETLAIYVCRGSISRIEDKKRTVTDIELKGFAEILGVTITELFDDYTETKEKYLNHTKSLLKF